MSGLTPGDPLGGEAPDRPRYGYTSPPPPGAGGPVPAYSGAVSGRPQLSGWWRRVVAAVLDGLIIGIGSAILLVAITAPFSIGFFANDTVGVVAVLVGSLLALGCIAVVSFLYAPYLMARWNGQTLGRKAVGIRVIRANGEPMTFWFAMLREVVVKALLFGFLGSITFGIASLLDVLWPLWDEENRALHDFIVNTRVIKD
jgi:uncharacterized RDD family membrane protein YckC